MFELTEADKVSATGRKLRKWIEVRQVALRLRCGRSQSDDPSMDAKMTAELRGRLAELEKLRKELLVGPEETGPAFGEDLSSPQM